MYRLSYLLFQGIFMFATHEDLPLLHNGVIRQVEARIRGKFACQDDVMNLDCRPSRALTIYYAEYSRKQASVCSRGNNAEYCDPVDKTSLVRTLCEGKIKCSVTVDKRTMGDKCPTVSKYLNVMYECKTLPPSTEPPYVQNKSTMVLTRPSTTSPLSNHSNGNSFHTTGNPTERFFYSSAIQTNEMEEESTSAVYGFVVYNGESVCTISGFLVALTLALIILL